MTGGKLSGPQKLAQDGQIGLVPAGQEEHPHIPGCVVVGPAQLSAERRTTAEAIPNGSGATRSCSLHTSIRSGSIDTRTNSGSSGPPGTNLASPGTHAERRWLRSSSRVAVPYTHTAAPVVRSAAA